MKRVKTASTTNHKLMPILNESASKRLGNRVDDLGFDQNIESRHRDKANTMILLNKTNICLISRLGFETGHITSRVAQMLTPFK